MVWQARSGLETLLLLPPMRAHARTCASPHRSAKAATCHDQGPLFSPSRLFRFAAEPCVLPCSSAGASTSASGGIRSVCCSLPPELHIIGLSVAVMDDQVAVAVASGSLLVLNISEALQTDADAPDASTQCGVQPAAGGAQRAPVLDAGMAGWAAMCGGFPTARARVVGLDACVHLPLLLVASADGGLRVYDWARRLCVATHHLPAADGEQLLCCALHPSGLMAAAGTSEGLLVCWVMRVSSNSIP